MTGNLNDYVGSDSRFIHCARCNALLFESGVVPGRVIVEVSATAGLIVRCHKHPERPLFEANNKDVEQKLLEIAGSQCPHCGPHEVCLH